MAQTVFVVDDDKDFRESLSWLLEGAGHSICAYASAEAFLENYEGQAGCLLLDVRMTGMSGLSLQQHLKEQGFTIPTVVITGHADVAMAVQAMKIGALDFVEKPFDDEVLLGLVDTALARDRKNKCRSNKQRSARERWALLSKREGEVANLVAKGHANREIGELLDISIKTVEIHRSRVMKKMQVNNVVGLIHEMALL